MAQVIKKNTDLAKTFLKYKGLSILGYALPFLGIFLFFPAFSDGNALLALLAVLIGIGGIFVGVAMGRKASIYFSGVSGEGRLMAVVEKLPEAFVGFQNVNVTYEGKTSEIDM
ncbi:MAG: hypothetical protein IKC69_06715, partial [Clostridia bacterium]|nr:hypothetical protein [Clostridia bacterium]